MTQVVAKKRTFRQIAIKLTLLIMSGSISLLLLEWGVRVALPYYAPNRQIPFRMMPNGMALGIPSQTVRQRTPKGDYDLPVHFNAKGFRDSRDFREARDMDWFAAGDSFTFGWGVSEEQRFSDRLEMHFRTNGPSSRVFNIAIPENIIGYQRLVAYAESQGATIRHLIVGVCMENDLHDYSDGRSAWERDHRGAIKVSKKEQARAWIKKHSALYLAASYTLQSSSFLRGLFEKAGLARDINTLTHKNEWNEKALQTCRDQVLKLVSGRDALILIIPSRGLWDGGNIKTEIRVHEAFVRLLRDAGLEVLDLKPALEQSGAPLKHYFKTDPHWNEHGHALAARELFNAIQARGQK